MQKRLDGKKQNKQVLSKIIIMGRMFEGLGAVSFIKSHDDIKIS